MPACFSPQDKRREEEDRIAERQIGDPPLGRVIDLISRAAAAACARRRGRILQG
jgi:hypothetical protein